MPGINSSVAREKLSKSEKALSGIIYERLGESESFARIRSKGDQALFGGFTTLDMERAFDARLAVTDLWINCNSIPPDHAGHYRTLGEWYNPTA